MPWVFCQLAASFDSLPNGDERVASDDIVALRRGRTLSSRILRNAMEEIMLDVIRIAAAAVSLAAALMMTTGGSRAADAKYPDWEGAWMRIPVKLPTQPSHDQTKPWGRGQEAPLTPEYQAILEASIADQAAGGLGNFPTTLGRAAGMPHMMMGFGPMEFVVTPKTPYIFIASYDHYPRIFSDAP